MSILFWSLESSIGHFREKGKELVIQEKQYKNFYFKYKKVKSLKVSTFKDVLLKGSTFIYYGLFVLEVYGKSKKTG